MRVIRRIWNFFSTLFVIGMILLAIALVGVRVVGLTPFAVLSGSMEPTYHVGSLIYVKDADPAEIKEGDPITFVVNEDLLVATHRVVGIETYTTGHREVKDENGQTVKDEDGNPVYEEYPLEETSYYFQTKGDANDDVDGSPVYYKNVIGVPVFTIPYLGYLSSWLQTKKGMIMGISIALVVLLLTFLPDILNAVDDEPKNSAPKKGKSGKREAADETPGEDAPKEP